MTQFTRRGLLKGAGTLACSAAAHPLLTSATFAAAPWDNRLVVIILRGAMDGLATLQPLGDPNLSILRPGFQDPATDLDGFYAMHDGLAALRPLWDQGQLAFAHAVSTPYRDKRSHFDGQDLLEAGTAMDAGSVRDGWLNRMMQTVPGVSGRTAFAIGRENMKILSGMAEVANWAPDIPFDLDANAQALLAHIYADDPLFHAAANEAVELATMISAEELANEGEPDPMMGMSAPPQGGGAERQLAAFAAERLREETRIAAFSINGWDTHRDQGNALTRNLEKLADVILTLKMGLGRDWGKTTVLAVTEFGRTARPNGSNGTDHGTGGAMLMAGGAIKGGQVFGRWPGLSEADLYDRRDLMPTADVRAYAAWAMRGAFGLGRSELQSDIFPGLDMGSDPGMML